NPLLALKPTRSAYLEIQQPACAALFNAFVLREKAWIFWLPPLPANANKAAAANLSRSPPLRGRGAEGEGESFATDTTSVIEPTTTSDEPPEQAGQASRLPHEPAVPRATDLVTNETDRQRLLQTLTNLYRRARADFRERGLQILHLACGMLQWRDEEN